MWHAEHEKVVDYVQEQDWDAKLQQQAVATFELPRDLEAARWGLCACLLLPGPNCSNRMARASSNWCALFPGFLYALLGKTLSGLRVGVRAESTAFHHWQGSIRVQADTSLPPSCRCTVDLNNFLCPSASELC